MYYKTPYKYSKSNPLGMHVPHGAMESHAEFQHGLHAEHNELTHRLHAKHRKIQDVI